MSLDLGPIPLNHAKYFPKILPMTIFTFFDLMLWPNILQFKRHIQKCALPRVPILSKTSQLIKLM